MNSIKGQCLCGAVRFESDTSSNKVGICHCGMCRRWGGGLAGAWVRLKVRLTNSNDLKWWKSSEWAERGFCGNCGSSMFWRVADSSAPPDMEWEVSVGVLEDDSNLEIADHIYTDNKPVFYDLADNKPRITEIENVVGIMVSLAKEFGTKTMEKALAQRRRASGDEFIDEVEHRVRAELAANSRQKTPPTG